MILTKEVEIIVATSNFKHFKNLGYENLFVGKKMLVPVKHLKRKSSAIIRAKCDICGKEKSLRYYVYAINFENQGWYCCSSKCSMGKKEQTYLRLYGVNNISQSEIIKNKVKETCLKNFGVENPNQNEDVKIKKKKTCMEKYGAENPMQNKKVAKKSKKTSLKKYGVNSPNKSEDVKNKKKITCLKNFGVENPSQNESVKNKKKKTCMEKYGVENVFQSKNILKKIKSVCLKKYGVEHATQNKEIHEKQQKSGFKRKTHKKTGLYYRGTYEKHFLDFCFDNKVPIKGGKTIQYFFEGKKRIYFSDFYLESKNLIIEIKSTYTYKKYLDKNLTKQRTCLSQGYSFIFIIDKNYDEFRKIFA